MTQYVCANQDVLPSCYLQGSLLKPHTLFSFREREVKLSGCTERGGKEMTTHCVPTARPQPDNPDDSRSLPFPVFIRAQEEGLVWQVMTEGLLLLERAQAMCLYGSPALFRSVGVTLFCLEALAAILGLEELSHLACPSHVSQLQTASISLRQLK